MREKIYSTICWLIDEMPAPGAARPNTMYPATRPAINASIPLVWLLISLAMVVGDMNFEFGRVLVCLANNWCKKEELRKSFNRYSVVLYKKTNEPRALACCLVFLMITDQRSLNLNIKQWIEMSKIQSVEIQWFPNRAIKKDKNLRSYVRTTSEQKAHDQCMAKSQLCTINDT